MLQEEVLKGNAHHKSSLCEAAKSKQTFCLLKYQYYECKIMYLLKYNEHTALLQDARYMWVFEMRTQCRESWCIFILGKKVGEMKHTETTSRS